MARPTEQDLTHAAGLLEELAVRYDARNNPNGWPEIVGILDLLVWRDVETDHAKHAAVYGPGSERSPEGGGTIGAHTIGHHFSRPTESRLDFGTDDEDRRNHRPRMRPELNDPLYRELVKLRDGWQTELAKQRNSMRRRADEAAHYPSRTKETG